MTTPDIEMAVDRACALLGRHIGLRAEPVFRRRLARCLRDAAAAYGLDPVHYVEELAKAPDAMQELLNRVTVQETAFFRHPAQFDALAHHVLAGRSTPITIWSAGCATGQEPHSLAMVLDELGIDGRIIATDISTKALDRTVRATYSGRELTGLSEHRRARHLAAAGKAWTVNPALRDRIHVLRHNLLDPVPSSIGAIDVVFCRNVLIYFSAVHVTQFLDQLADRLSPGAFLFLGPAETIWPTTDRFELVSTDDGYFYRRAALPIARPHTGPVATTRRRPAAPTALARRSRPARDMASRAARPLPGPVAAEIDSPTDLVQRGEASFAAGAHADAVVAFRRWAYLQPDNAAAHLHLALALEASGDRGAAARAFDATRSAIRRADHTPVLDALGGYQLDDLRKLLDTKRSELPR